LALDLSNIGPGSVTKSTKSRAQIRAELAAKRKRLNAGGPGTAGYTPPNMMRPAQVSPPLSNRGYAGSNNIGPAPLPVREDTFAGLQFANVDTMLFKDRLSGARTWYESKGKAFNQSADDREAMIRAGLMSYGKTAEGKYDTSVTSINTPALNQFLNDNYTNDGGKWKRKTAKLSLTDTAIQYATYGGVDQTISAAEAQKDFLAGKRVRGNLGIAGSLTNVPTKGKGAAAVTDYGKMADSYAKDNKTKALWESKITKKISKEGGSALWNKIMTGKYSAADVEGLRQYMYSPNGEYGDAQEQFIQESLLKKAFDPMESIRANDAANIQDLMAANDKEDAKALEAQNKISKEFTDTYFGTGKVPATPEQQFTNLLGALSGTGDNFKTGLANQIPSSVIEQIMRDGVGRMVEDKSVLGGKRFEPAPMRGFTEAQKASLVQAAVDAQEKGYPIPGALRPYLDAIIGDFEVKAGNQHDGSGAGSFVDMLYGVAGKGDNSVSYPGQTPNVVLPDGVEALSKGLQAGLASQELASQSSYLAYEENSGLAGWLGNWVKGAGRAGTGFMPGLYYLGTDPITTTGDMIDQYKHNYGTWDGFTAHLSNDPFAVFLDGLGLVDGIGMLGKGGQIVSATSKLSKAGKLGDAASGIASAGEKLTPEARVAAEKVAADSVDWAAEPTPMAPATNGYGISRLEYAALMRKVAVGDLAAKATLEFMLPKGTNASNSLLRPSLMDHVAGMFEPRYKMVQRSDGNNSVVDQGRSEAVAPDAPVALRFSGNPINRGIQNAFFSAQTRGGKLSPRIANINLLGFNYRFDKAYKEQHLGVAEGVRREMSMLHLYDKAISEMGLTDIEQQVIMDQATGGAPYTPAMMAGVIRRKLADEAKGMEPAQLEILMADLRRYEDPEFMRDYANTKNDLVEGVSPRGKQLAEVQDVMVALLEKQNRLVTAFDDPATIEAALRAYGPITTAARLNPSDIMRELGASGENLGMFNPNFHLNEQLRLYAEDFVLQDGKYGRRKGSADEMVGIMKEIRDSANKIKDDLAFRDLGGLPFFTVNEIVRVAGKPVAVRGQRLIIDGKTATHERLPLLDPEVLTIPYSAMVPSKNGKGVLTLSKAQAAKQLHIGAVNFLNKVYPNVRDMVDKVSTHSLNTNETYRDRANHNVVASSGIQNYHLKVQLDAHAAYLRRRATEGWTQFFDDTAIPIRADQFDSKNFVALRTHKFFDTYDQAYKYAMNYNEVGAVEPGIVDEVTVAGEPKFVTKMRYFDVMLNTVIEQKTRVPRGTADYEKAYLDDISKIDTSNPNNIVMAVPKDTYNRFASTQRGIDALLKDTLAGKSGGLLSQIFKVTTLSLNPKFIPQNVIGSSMMVGLATPELFPQIMSGLWQKAARSKGAKLEDKNVFSNHASDFNYITRMMPHDFLDNAYAMDRAEGIGNKLGDSKIAKYTLFGGYTVVFGFETNMRVALIRAAALKYPGFKSLMGSKAIQERAAAGVPEVGIERMSPFQAAFESLRDPTSPVHDPNFMHHVRFTADGVLGNYRDFGPWESAVRNYLVPFYAWQRHSALFSKRLIQERPLAANAAYNTGQYGFEKVLSAAGLPDWMYESIPMPDALMRFLELDPEQTNRLILGGLNPFSATTDAVVAGTSALAGKGFMGSSKGLFDYTNPFINATIEQFTGNSTLTGAPLSQEEKDAGILAKGANIIQGFPALKAITDLFKSPEQMNALRGMTNPEDIFVNADDPNSKLSIPGDKLSTRFPTGTRAGLFNLVSPVRAMSLNAEALLKQYKQDQKDRGLSTGTAKMSDSALVGHINSLVKWKRNRDFIINVYLPQFGEDNGALAARATAELQKEFPKLPDSFPKDLYDQIMNGGG
jgi:hypothetical protein